MHIYNIIIHTQIGYYYIVSLTKIWLIIIDKIIKSSPSRIINTSSLAYVGAKLDFELMKNFKQYNYKDTTYNQFVLYANSKLANIYFTKVLAEKLINKGKRLTFFNI